MAVTNSYSTLIEDLHEKPLKHYNNQLHLSKIKLTQLYLSTDSITAISITLEVIRLYFLFLSIDSSPGGGGYSTYPWVGRCDAAPHTLNLFNTNIADFPILFKTELRFLIPCLRHLTRILINKSL